MTLLYLVDIFPPHKWIGFVLISEKNWTLHNLLLHQPSCSIWSHFSNFKYFLALMSKFLLRSLFVVINLSNLALTEGVKVSNQNKKNSSKGFLFVPCFLLCLYKGSLETVIKHLIICNPGILTLSVKLHSGLVCMDSWKTLL